MEDTLYEPVQGVRHRPLHFSCR